jgi:probable HAF family extracellular repeat protein
MTDLLSRAGGPHSAALAVSDAGTVVGTAGARPFRWQSGRFTWLLARGAGAACGVDDYGEAVGWLQLPELEGKRPAHWRRDAVRLLELPDDAMEGCAEALSQSGLAVGTVRRVDGTQRATTWRPGDVSFLPNPRPGSSTSASAVAGAWIAGTSQLPGGQPQACVWHGGDAVDLGCRGVVRSEAHDVNRHGVVVGEMTNANGNQRACRWTDGRVRDLGTLGGLTSVAHGVNDRGQIIGEADTPDGWRHACAWVGGDIHDLGTLGGPTSSAFAINDQGTVVGIGSTGVGALGVAIKHGGWSWEEHAFACRVQPPYAPSGGFD